MSLFIGNGTGGNALLHVTSNIVDANTIAGGPLPTTVFHTDIPFVTAEVFTLQGIVRVNNGYYTGTIGTLTTDAIAAIRSRFVGTLSPVVLVAVDGVIQHTHGLIFNARSFIWDYLDTNSLPAGAYTGHSNVIPSSTYRYKMVNGILGSSISLIVSSLSYNSVDGAIVNTANSLFTGTSASISAADVIIRGTSLKNTKFMTFSNVGVAAAFVGNSSGSKVSIVNNAGSTSTQLYIGNSAITLKNNLNETIFDSNLGKISTVDVSNVPGYTTIVHNPGTGYREWVINNIVATEGGAILFMTNFPTTLQIAGVWSTLYIGSSTYTFLYDMVVTSRNTTYGVYIKVALVSGVWRYVIKMQLDYLAPGGDYGSPHTSPVFNRMVVIK